MSQDGSMQGSERAFDRSAQAELVARGQLGDPTAIARIYDDTFDAVYRFALVTSRNQQDAEDITSETYERALRRLDRFQSGDTPILAWLIGIARNVAREHFRWKRRMPSVSLALEEIVDESSATQPADGIAPLLDLLTPAQREVMTLRLAGLSGAEVAACLGKAEGTVRAQQFAAIHRLRGMVHR